MIGKNAQAQIRAYVERIERVDEQVDEFKGDRKDILKEAKSQGFNAEAIQAVVRIRRQDADKRKTLQDDVDLCMHALGMTPLETIMNSPAAQRTAAAIKAGTLTVDLGEDFGRFPADGNEPAPDIATTGPDTSDRPFAPAADPLDIPPHLDRRKKADAA